MSDIYCAKCGEPWEAYGIAVNDATTEDEGKRIRKGEGCPCCAWGTQCTTCNGSGFYDESYGGCKRCNGNRKVLAWRYLSGGSGAYADRKWRTGYTPNVERVPVDAEQLGYEFDRQASVDGAGVSGWFACWECDPATAPKCEACNGDGKLHIDGDPDELELEAARSDCASSDEDPFDILQRRGLV